MGFKNLVDFHLHTDNSDDGFDPVMLMCEHAVNAGLRAVAITDHCEINRYRADIYRFDKSIRQSFIEAKGQRTPSKPPHYNGGDRAWAGNPKSRGHKRRSVCKRL